MSAPTITVTVNGTPGSWPPGTCLDRVVAEVSRARSGIAVAVGDSVVPRTQWPGWALADGDVVEILTAVQGG
ncbi:MAG TPA: sulfur carrier protein ThiS [Actinocrinis sp.]|nr:sulfur carrier protein ThiS [Actinocrinis sp.]